MSKVPFTVSVIDAQKGLFFFLPIVTKQISSMCVYQKHTNVTFSVWKFFQTSLRFKPIPFSF